ncbi:MAG TPA: pilus assembly protein PilY, partial [Aeromonadales bacterium]|nr:pilus assembly protein PilY [Aeromonadales bacterium]
DDIWHAAFNSNGTYASASSAAAVAEKLIAAISNIAGRIGSASAVALNSGTLNANSRVYQAKFDSNDWSGALVSIPIQSGQTPVAPATTTCTSEALGELCPQEWNAAEELESMNYNVRKVFTRNIDTGTAVEFKTLSDLAASQQTALRTNPDTAAVESTTIGQQRLNYVLGDNSNEGTASSEFRVRKLTALGTGKLGDIIHSSPAFSGAPDSFYPDLLEGVGNSYNAYRLANENRTPMVYVGANDGMLHAFNGADGSEEFAYIPGPLVNKLNQLSSKNYNNGHTYFVDGSPKIFDAFDGSSWKTMLASSVGAGGQTVFGLDITDPDGFSTADVKWEFSDADDADLGYTIGDVTFARMNNDKWVVIFGNGYNNTEPDGNVSSTGNAVIYVVDAFTGALIKKFDTGVGTADDPLNPGSNRPNGMARVSAVDLDGDFNADYLYAGDLFGNVWKVDVSATSTASWDFAYKDGVNPKPFFIAKDSNGDVQPITAGVAVKRHPLKKSQTIVLFGTGKYMEVGDSAIPTGGGPIYSFYGVWDDNTASQYSRSQLLQQEILNQTVVSGADGIDREFRVTSSSEQPAYKIDWTSDKGWYMDLRYSNFYGERVVVEPVVRNGRVIFVTLIPDEDPCSSGGDGWIMELNADSGSRLPASPFDVNGDGIIDGDDFVNYSSEDTIVSGVKSRSGIVAKPGILNNPKGGTDEYKYFSGTSGKVDIVGESSNPNSRRRQS